MRSLLVCGITIVTLQALFIKMIIRLTFQIFQEVMEESVRKGWEKFEVVCELYFFYLRFCISALRTHSLYCIVLY